MHTYALTSTHTHSQAHKRTHMHIHTNTYTHMTAYFLSRPMPSMSTSAAKGVRLTRALRMETRPSGGGKGTYRILSRRPAARAHRGQGHVQDFIENRNLSRIGFCRELGGKGTYRILLRRTAVSGLKLRVEYVSCSQGG